MGGLFGGGRGDGGASAQLEEQRRENERLKKQAEEERRELGEKSAASRMARMRGGSRMLLSETRIAPEEGVTTLGAGRNV
jgi:hypothetical protein